jgi:outer membrane lipopolysaccharide assembly protein LptE/RlpB
VYSGQVLGNNQEEGTLYQSLRRNVIQKILFKLSSEDAKAALVKNNS